MRTCFVVLTKYFVCRLLHRSYINGWEIPDLCMGYMPPCLLIIYIFLYSLLIVWYNSVYIYPINVSFSLRNLIFFIRNHCLFYTAVSQQHGGRQRTLLSYQLDWINRSIDIYNLCISYENISSNTCILFTWAQNCFKQTIKSCGRISYENISSNTCILFTWV